MPTLVEIPAPARTTMLLLLYINSTASSKVEYVGRVLRICMVMMVRLGVSDRALSDTRYGTRNNEGDTDSLWPDGVLDRRGVCGAEEDMLMAALLCGCCSQGKLSNVAAQQWQE